MHSENDWRAGPRREADARARFPLGTRVVLQPLDPTKFDGYDTQRYVHRPGTVIAIHGARDNTSAQGNLRVVFDPLRRGGPRHHTQLGAEDLAAEVGGPSRAEALRTILESGEPRGLLVDELWSEMYRAQAADIVALMAAAAAGQPLLAALVARRAGALRRFVEQTLAHQDFVKLEARARALIRVEYKLPVDFPLPLHVRHGVVSAEFRPPGERLLVNLSVYSNDKGLHLSTDRTRPSQVPVERFVIAQIAAGPVTPRVLVQRAQKLHKWTRDLVDQKLNALEQAGIVEREGPGLDALLALSNS